MKKALLISLLVLTILLVSCIPQEPKDECNVLKGQTTIDNCYFEKAISTANISSCKKIKMEPLKEACISEIGIAVNDLNICQGLDETTQGSCYAKIAINNQDESTCQLIKSNYWWDICHYEIGIAKNKVTICSEMYDQERAGECFAKIAEAKKDESSCSLIPKKTSRYFCYIKLALIKGNVSICNRIDNSVWRDGNCIKRVAENSSNASICELITIANIKQDCLGKFES